MSQSKADAVQDLLRRIDDVRGLSGRTDDAVPLDPSDAEAVLRTLGELVDELERSHRRLIETNVQLVSLREVASSLLISQDVAETTRTVTRYACRAYAFDEAFLLLLDADREVLHGTWTSRSGERDRSIDLEIPLRGDRGAIARSFWLNRTVVHHAPRQHRPALVPDGHPLQDIFERLAALACVPLQRSHSVLPSAEPHELCGAGCMLGDIALMVPPPGTAAEEWPESREQRQQQCMRCDLLPLLGVIGFALRSGASTLGHAEIHLLESIALSVAPIVENARLYQDLRKSERFREHVLDSMAGALVAVNMRGEILTFNRAAETLLGFSEAEVLNEPFGALFGNEGEALIAATLEQGQEATREEAMLRARDGSPVPVSLSTSLLRNEHRNVYGAIATFVDLTPLRRAEEHARRLDRLAALGRFTSSVAHEIRNPLTGIATGVQYLERSMSTDAPQRENLSFILREIQRLDRIVQDLFDITHPRGLNARVAPIDDTIRRALQVLRGALEAGRVSVELNVSPRAPAIAHDADQLEQVFINLVKNATEASAPGQAVQVSVQAAAPSEGQAMSVAGEVTGGVSIRVRDFGAGISHENLKTIFEPFFTTKPQGTGLGLYICHDIVKRHGGTLAVHSEPGRGTTFTVELPLEIDGGNP
jgi:PAS domain S-box-containing protein